MANLDEFSEIIARLGRQVEQNALLVVRRVALAADQAVVVATPVDTGRARSNWLVTIDAPDPREIPPYSQDDGAGSARAAVAQGQAAIAAFAAGNRAIYITNNLPYIERLNQGSSAQAPASFVQQAVIMAARAVQASSLLRPNGLR